jgi:hypothetical protein
MGERCFPGVRACGRILLRFALRPKLGRGPQRPPPAHLQVGAPKVVVQVHLARVLGVGGCVGVEARTLAALEVVDPFGGKQRAGVGGARSDELRRLGA